MKSMTGFGQAKMRSAEVSLDVTVRSVNGRFLETRIHLPKEYFAFESEIKKKVAVFFQRGTVDVYVFRRPGEKAEPPKISVNIEFAKQWMKSYKLLAKNLKMPADFNLESLIDREGVLSVDQTVSVSAAEKKHVLAAVEKALDACQKERSREGNSLKNELLELLSALGEITERIYELRSRANEQLSEKLLQRLKSLNFPGEIDPQRLAQEVIIQVDRGDVSEEIVRLREHVQHMKKFLGGADPAGKKMDFYTQELLREINTIGSKSSLSDLTENVVNAKATIEKIREQVQNIE